MQQAEQLALQAERSEQLTDELAILKGEQPRPKITPTLKKAQPDGAGQEGEKKGRRRGKPSRKKTQALEIKVPLGRSKSVPPRMLKRGQRPLCYFRMEWALTRLSLFALLGQAIPLNFLKRGSPGRHYNPNSG